ncbi:chromosome partitioning protein [Micromonospora sp. NPDC051296]|uniref:MinD/ParA family ATP-binding protein n=1 Tax=Micromonospora sp. NPDC051296 TaxID=3155046 RepID=UPI00343E8F12
MVDENADRVHVPGQHGVPERDIEPLWPPEQIDGFGAPAWGAPPPAPPTVPPSPAHPASPPAPPISQPPTGHSAHPPAPPTGHPPAIATSPADYPSLTGDGPAATGWESPSPPASGWGSAAPPTSGWGSAAPPTTGEKSGPPPAAAWGPPAPSGPQPEPAQVDLDLPFTLDRPTSLAPARDGAPAGARPPAGTAGDGDTGPDMAADSGGAADTGPGSPDGTGGGAGATADTGQGSPGGGAAPPVARPPAESPWAQPPQRPASDGAAELPGSTDHPPRPTWAGPAQPLPPVPQPTPGPPVPQQAGPYSPATQLPPVPQPGAPLAPVSQYDTPAPQHGSPPVPQYDSPASPAPQPWPVPPVPQTPGPPTQPADSGSPAQPYPGPTEPPYAAPPPGPFPPQPAWNPAPWQQGGPPPVAPPVAQRPYQPTDTASRVPPAFPEPAWSPEVGTAPTAEDFARRRQVRPADPVATMGVRAVVNKTGLVKLPPGRHELELKRDIEMVRRNFGGLRQVTVVNPKGGAGKTVAILLLAMTFGQKRGGYVLAWDNNETQGTLGMRAQQDFHSRTVRDLLRDLGQFHGAHGRVGDLSQYVRSQGEGMFDVLASDESATGGEMLTAAAFGEIREVVSRFYKLIFVDTGNNVRAQNWQAAMDATDQLVVTMSARNDSAETAARMLDHLEQSGRQRLVRQAVTVVSMPPSRKEIDLPAIEEHFAARTRAVLLAPYERLIDTGEPLRYAHLSAATRDAWLKIAAAVAEGL